ncbi:5-oxoprolinase subunit PxpB [Bacillus kwashiorkori]|uniref:5-oxoprolinase subunit PxpB n=1 Tax=Bacillus kwashiorkori TaxID=1522318 RepID=UPI000785F9BF|nr:5-oxoprolinase subunit PxpB [Bacillus kwashiorkori]
MIIHYDIFPLGQEAIVVQLGQEFSKETNIFVYTIAKYLNDHPFEGFVEVVPSFTSLTIHFDSKVASEQIFEQINDLVEQILNKMNQADLHKQSKVRIPVCYDPEFAIDLPFVANLNKVSIPEFIEIHSNETYFVSYLSFGSGIPFIGGINKHLSVPRKKSPKFYLPMGSVGIAGRQTGIYPIKTAVGWQIIGRTPLSFLKKHKDLFMPGTEVQFTPISTEQFMDMETAEAYKKIISF